jgi:hypothetical protein
MRGPVDSFETDRFDKVHEGLRHSVMEHHQELTVRDGVLAGILVEILHGRLLGLRDMVR